MTLTGKTIVAASSGAEQKEAPPAKKANRDDEQIYVRARDGEEVMISREVARLAGHLKDLMDDASSEGSVYPAPMVAASTLRSLVRMSELLSDGADWEACPPKLDKLFADLLALERCTDADYDRTTDAIASGAKTEAELISEWAPMGLKIGALVKIKNLKSRPELNGSEATVIDFRIANKRYGLQLSGGEGEKIAVKPDNIQEVCGMDAAPAASAASTSTLVEVTNYSAGADTAYFGVPVEGERLTIFVMSHQPHEHSEGLTGLVAELPPGLRAYALARLSPRLRQPVAEALFDASAMVRVLDAIATIDTQCATLGEYHDDVASSIKNLGWLLGQLDEAAKREAVGKKLNKPVPAPAPAPAPACPLQSQIAELEGFLRQIAELKELKASGKPLNTMQLYQLAQEPAIELARGALELKMCFGKRSKP